MRQEVRTHLGVVDHRLGDDGVDLELAFGRHCRGCRWDKASWVL